MNKSIELLVAISAIYMLHTFKTACGCIRNAHSYFKIDHIHVKYY